MTSEDEIRAALAPMVRFAITMALMRKGMLKDVAAKRMGAAACTITIMWCDQILHFLTVCGLDENGLARPFVGGVVGKAIATVDLEESLQRIVDGLGR